MGYKIFTGILGSINFVLLILAIVKKNINYFLIALGISFIFAIVSGILIEINKKKKIANKKSVYKK